MIIAIFAIDEQGGMGLQGSMPWPFNKDDMKWFKSTTTSHVVVMGKKTWTSTGMPKPLPNRTNVIFTSEKLLANNLNVEFISGNVVEQLLSIQQRFLDKDIFVIGGANILIQAEPAIEKIYLTRIKGNYNCDVIIDINEFTKNFTLTDNILFDSCNIEQYERISPST